MFNRERPPMSVGSETMSPELAGLAEVAEVCGVSKQMATRYTRRPGFPEPVDRLAAGPVWRRSEIEAWAKETLPLRRRKPAS
jgi:predicted DNA-binding transcriptional regulator AlpA